MSWSEKELAYMAGIIDGEGTISIDYRFHRKNKSAHKYHRPYLSVPNTDKRLIDWIHQRFSGCIAFRAAKNNSRALYEWHAKTSDLEKILNALLPYLFLKKEQAELILRIKKTIVLGTKKLSIETVSYREEITKRIRVLNSRGTNVINL